MKDYFVPIALGVAIIAGIIFLMSDIGDRPDQDTPRDPMTGKTEFNIPVQDKRMVAAGDTLYQDNCASCHGTDLRGTDKGPSHLTIIYNPEHHQDGAFAAAVTRGVKAHHWNYGDMPAIPAISESDFRKIVAYVRENQRVEGFEAYRRR